MSVTLSFDFKYKIKIIIAFFNLTPKNPNVKKPHFAILDKEWGFLGLPPPPIYNITLYKREVIKIPYSRRQISVPKPVGISRQSSHMTSGGELVPQNEEVEQTRQLDGEESLDPLEDSLSPVRHTESSNSTPIRESPGPPSGNTSGAGSSVRNSPEPRYQLRDRTKISVPERYS